MVENDHSACVDAWMDRVAKRSAPEELVDLFERGFGAMWTRAHRTLGDVTLTAIADRVLHTAKEQFPSMATLEVETSGLRCQVLRERAAGLQREELALGIRFVLVEFLTVLGNLTAEVLSASLHAELSKDAIEERGESRNPDRHGEDAGS